VSLSDILNPIDAESFFAEYFEAKPLLVARGKSTYFQSLLNLDDIDRLLTTTDLRHPDITLVKAEQPIDDKDYTFKDQAINVLQLFRLHHDGATIIFNHLHSYHPPLTELCAALEMTFSAPVQTNIYVTPPRAKGFKAHFDTHDVFILQVNGTKKWRLYGTPIPLPLEGQFEEVADDNTGSPTTEIELKCGDTLYIPRGMIHDAISCDDTSVHITVGVLSFTWSDVMVEALAKTILLDPDFRRALPADFTQPTFDSAAARKTFGELMQRFVTNADFNDAFATFVQEFIDRRRPRLRGQMAQLGQLATIGSDSVIRGRPQIAYTINEYETDVRIRCYGSEISIPIFAATAVRFALATPLFKVRDLPELDESSKLVLVRRLLREGILYVAEVAGANNPHSN